MTREGRTANDLVAEALGGLDPTAVFGAEVDELLFDTGNRSRVIGVRTVEGIDLVAKSRPDSERVDAVSVVQRALHDAGHPVPEPPAWVDWGDDTSRPGRALGRNRDPCAWAAALWHRAFNARKDAADGGGTQLDLFRRDLGALRARAGLD